MITLTAQIPVVNSIANLNKFKVVNFNDPDGLNPPGAEILIQFQGSSGKIYLNGTFSLWAYDSGPCMTVIVNPNSISTTDQLMYAPVTIANCYTTISSAYYGASGKNAARLAVEAALLSTGLLGSAFAGS